MELILFIHCLKAAIVCKTSVPLHFNDNSIAMFPFPSLSIKETPLFKRIKEVSMLFFSEEQCKGVRRPSELVHGLLMKHHHFMELSFLLDVATSNGFYVAGS